jgi:N-acetylglucosaminyldiphosphoundecaprenol N-acetyl-beta-D-mannosaminyltransferase
MSDHDRPQSSLPKPQTFQVMGHDISLFEKDTFLSTVADRVESGPRTVFAHVNLHSLASLLTSPKMEALFDRPNTFVHIDGMPLVALAKLKGARATSSNRLAAIDFAEDLMALAAERGWKVAYVGSGQDACTRIVDLFCERHPGLDFRGWNGFFDPSDRSVGSRQTEVVSEIAAFAPDLLFVGMGQPRQESWLHDNLDDLCAKVAVPVGAMFEYFVGEQKIPPRWLGPLGIEWAYRLLGDPRRLAGRYLVEPVVLAVRSHAYRRRRTSFGIQARAKFTVS